jgi:hypothetical protein
MGTEIKRMNIKEFRESGYLQEVNRRFLHLLGLALEVTIDDNSGEEYISGVWDYREDEEGIYYDFKNSSKERIERAEQKANFIDNEIEKRRNKRIENLGSLIENISNKSNNR